MECLICYNESNADSFKKLDRNHSVCANCFNLLRKNKTLKCPFCRAPINDDLENMNMTLKYISYEQLLAFGIEQAFITSIIDRLPFYYTSRIEAADFIVSTKDEYKIWQTSILT